MQLTMVAPITVDNTNIVLANGDGVPVTNVAVESTYPLWRDGIASSGTTSTHTVGDIVYFGTRRYECILTHTAPGGTANEPQNQPTRWLDIGPTTRYRPFDSSVTSKADRADNITYSISSGDTVINGVGVLGVENGDSITVEVYSGDVGWSSPAYSETVDIGLQPLISDWWSWLFGGRFRKTQGVFLSLPSYTDAIIVISIDGTADLAVGEIVMGRQFAFGLGIEYGARVGIKDYSRKSTDDFGNTIVLRRAFAKRATFDMHLRKGEVDPMIQTLSDYRATPVLYIGSDQYESTTVYGFYKNFDVLISYPEYSQCNLELEGVT